jgi:hypothetical protein
MLTVNELINCCKEDRGLLTLGQSFSTFFNSRHTEQGARIVKTHRQFL